MIIMNSDKNYRCNHPLGESTIYLWREKNTKVFLPFFISLVLVFSLLASDLSYAASSIEYLIKRDRYINELTQQYRDGLLDLEEYRENLSKLNMDNCPLLEEYEESVDREELARLRDLSDEDLDFQRMISDSLESENRAIFHSLYPREDSMPSDIASDSNIKDVTDIASASDITDNSNIASASDMASASDITSSSDISSDIKDSSDKKISVSQCDKPKISLNKYILDMEVWRVQEEGKSLERNFRDGDEFILKIFSVIPRKNVKKITYKLPKGTVCTRGDVEIIDSEGIARGYMSFRSGNKLNLHFNEVLDDDIELYLEIHASFQKGNDKKETIYFGGDDGFIYLYPKNESVRELETQYKDLSLKAVFSESVFPEDVEFSVSEIEENELLNTSRFYPMDIHFSVNGMEIEPDGDVEIFIEGEDFKEYNWSMWHRKDVSTQGPDMMNLCKGVLEEEIELKETEEGVSFVSESFSNYYLAGERKEIEFLNYEDSENTCNFSIMILSKEEPRVHLMKNGESCDEEPTVYIRYSDGKKIYTFTWTNLQGDVSEYDAYIEGGAIYGNEKVLTWSPEFVCALRDSARNIELLYKDDNDFYRFLKKINPDEEYLISRGRVPKSWNGAPRDWDPGEKISPFSEFFINQENERKSLFKEDISFWKKDVDFNDDHWNFVSGDKNIWLERRYTLYPPRNYFVYGFNIKNGEVDNEYTWYRNWDRDLKYNGYVSIYRKSNVPCKILKAVKMPESNVQIESKKTGFKVRLEGSNNGRVWEDLGEISIENKTTDIKSKCFRFYRLKSLSEYENLKVEDTVYEDMDFYISGYADDIEIIRNNGILDGNYYISNGANEYVHVVEEDVLLSKITQIKNKEEPFNWKKSDKGNLDFVNKKDIEGKDIEGIGFYKCTIDYDDYIEVKSFKDFLRGENNIYDSDGRYFLFEPVIEKSCSIEIIDYSEKAKEIVVEIDDSIDLPIEIILKRNDGEEYRYRMLEVRRHVFNVPMGYSYQILLEADKDEALIDPDKSEDYELLEVSGKYIIKARAAPVELPETGGRGNDIYFLISIILLSISFIASKRIWRYEDE